MTSRTKNHPGGEVLEQYSLGTLPETATELVEEHLLVCEQCRDELVTAESFISEMKQACADLRRQPEPHRSRFWSAAFSLPRPALAAAFAALIAVIVLPFAANRRTIDSTPATMALESLRDDQIGSVKANKPLHLLLNTNGLERTALQVEIVNSNGTRAWAGTPAQSREQLIIDVRTPLSPGMYWVRIFEADKQVREFGLRVR